MTMADSAATSSIDGLRPVRVWNLPTRVFDCVLAAASVGSAVDAKVGGNAMQWPVRTGYVVAALRAAVLAGACVAAVASVVRLG